MLLDNRSSFGVESTLKMFLTPILKHSDISDPLLSWRFLGNGGNCHGKISGKMGNVEGKEKDGIVCEAFELNGERRSWAAGEEIDAVMNVNGGQKNESGCMENDFDLKG